MKEDDYDDRKDELKKLDAEAGRVSLVTDADDDDFIWRYWKRPMRSFN
jgi:hypothetical protein